MDRQRRTLGRLTGSLAAGILVGPLLMTAYSRATADSDSTWLAAVPLVATHVLDGAVSSLGFDPRNPLHMLVGTTSGVRFIDAVSGKILVDLRDREAVCRRTSEWVISPDGSIIAASFPSGDRRAGVFLCDAWSGQVRWVLSKPPIGDRFGFRLPVFSPDGRYLAAPHCFVWGAGFHVWDLTSRKVVGVVESPFWFVFAVAFSPDGKTLAASTWGDGGIHLWEFGTWDYVRSVYVESERNAYVGEANKAWSLLTFSPDGRYLAAGAEDGDVRIFDLRSGGQRQLVGHVAKITGLAFCAGGDLLVSGSADGSVRLWEVVTGLPAGILCAGGGPVTATAVSADGTFLAVGDASGQVLVYALGELGIPQLPESILASQTFLDVNGDGLLEVIELYLADGVFADAPETGGWCGEGLKWSGSFNIRVRRGSTILAVQSLGDVLGWDTAWFRPPRFRLLTGDYNDDGQPDFALCQYACCVGSWLRLLTVETSGRVRPLSSQAFPVGAHESCWPDRICKVGGMLGFTFYENASGMYLTNWYQWEDSELHFVETTIAFCNVDP